jgi:hypothetical protein
VRDCPIVVRLTSPNFNSEPSGVPHLSQEKTFIRPLVFSYYFAIESYLYNVIRTGFRLL